jgi:hypothetical protein
MALRRRFRVSLAAPWLWGLVALVPACASGQEWIYEKPRTTPAQVDLDRAACRKIAPSTSVLKTFESEKVDRPAFNRCMEQRGYTVKAAPLP